MDLLLETKWIFRNNINENKKNTHSNWPIDHNTKLIPFTFRK